ncbi:DNA-binding domain-containing protein [Neptunomonas japonica]|uniref:HvfC/BufC N-terminal domain-containing protein n=1 Tax=Neptunomonas japonica TaxID=417574 RepID=UPI0004038D9F|nr:DNA-binding domain-containing protein [Neptunomonas japonica]
MAISSYIDAFSIYLRTGDVSGMNDFCVNAEHLKRMSVYRNGFYKGCVDALAANFPMCEKFVGSNNFKDIARIYVDHYPPEKGTLVGYGLNFPDFLDDFITELKKQPEVLKLPTNLTDLARLDYAWLMSLMSADTNQALTAEKVTWLMNGGYDFTQSVVTLSASVILLQVRVGTLMQWIALKTNSSEIVQEENSANELAQSENSLSSDLVMLWRVQGSVQVRALSSPEWAVMHALQGEGDVLEKAFDTALVLDSDFDVSDVFSACIQNEILEIDMTKYNHNK